MTDSNAQKPNTFTIDDREIDIREGESIFRAARRLDIKLPHLCYSPKSGYRADGNCRVCMVEIEGERVLAASCIRTPSPGMKVKTATERAKTARRMVAELLLTDQPAIEVAHDPQSEFWKVAKRQNISAGRFPKREAVAVPAPDRSHPAMAVNLDACIHCNLCVRACREVQVNDVIGMAGRGHGEKIVFDFDDPMGNSTCVACGECVQACPTGALMPATLVDAKNVRTEFPDRTVDSVCPYCGVGCQLTYHIKNDKLLYVSGRDGPANQNRLCVKGRFGFDYVSNPQRLMKPMVRKDGVKKAADDLVDPANPFTHFREATWEEAMARAASGLKKIRDRDGPRALAGFGSAKGSNEEAYLFQKLVRTGFGSNNVDHCTRLCHASSVAALLEGVGSAAVTATFNECKNSDFIIVIGANPTENHPVAATFFKQAAKRGAKLVVMDPRGQALKRHAWQMMQFKNGTDVAMLNAMLNVIVSEKLYDQQYVQTYVEGFAPFAESIKDFTPEEMAPICGIPADTLRNVARSYARDVAQRVGGNAADRRHLLGREVLDALGEGREAFHVGLHILLVVQLLADDDVEHAVEHGHVGAVLELHHLPGVALERLPARVHHHQLGAALGRLLEESGGDRMVLGRVGPDDNNKVGILALVEGRGHRGRADAFQQRRHRGGVAQPRAVVDIVGAKAGAHQLLSL